jgi:maltooligosyltrehalose trehalohydrolase
LSHTRRSRTHAFARRLPVGAEFLDGGVHFRVWTPNAVRVSLVLEEGEVPLEGESGYFSGQVQGLGHGALYRFRLDGGELLADPVSRFQPDGPFGPSMVVDPRRYRWRDSEWRGAPARPVLYEMHIGTFTPEGTYAAAMARLPHLAEIGINAIELMPLADIPGGFNWGYDGVSLFAPTRLYGEPDGLRAFVDAAHAHGIAVIHDVVYNHIGSVGAVFSRYAEAYFSERYSTDWGPSLNFDGPGCEGAREFVDANIRMWIDEYHFDGFRVDATQNIYDFDEGHEHVLAMMARTAREAAGGRRVLMVGENEQQTARLVRGPEAGASASTPSGTTTSTTRHALRSPADVRPTTRITLGARRNWFRRRAMASCTRASSMAGRASRVERARSTSRRGSSSTSCRTMIRSRMPRAGCRFPR